MTPLKFWSLGLSLAALIAVTYILCVVFDGLFPGWAMYTVWRPLFPGFDFTVLGFLIGLVESVLYGLYAGAIFVPVYNFLQRRATAA